MRSHHYRFLGEFMILSLDFMENFTLCVLVCLFIDVNLISRSLKGISWELLHGFRQKSKSVQVSM